MKKCIIIDDEPLARSITLDYLKNEPDLQVVQECNDGLEGFKAIQVHQPDLVFLDIQMPKISGFEMLELLDNPPAIIFTTAFDEFAIKAFETNTIDYLLKPFSQERFQKAIAKFRQTLPGSQQTQTQQLLQEVDAASLPKNRVVVKDQQQIKILPAKEIYFLEADDDTVKIHSSTGVYAKNKTLSSFEKSLDETQFIRVHRSYLVNTAYINRIEVYEKEGHLAILTNGARVPVSRNGYVRLKTELGI